MSMSFCSLSCEPLEPRSLFSVTLFNGILTIVGTGGHDLIEVQNRADKGEVRVEMNGTEREFAKADVTRIVIFGEAGNDRIGFSGRDGVVVWNGSGILDWYREQTGMPEWQ